MIFVRFAFYVTVGLAAILAVALVMVAFIAWEIPDMTALRDPWSATRAAGAIWLLSYVGFIPLMLSLRKQQLSRTS